MKNSDSLNKDGKSAARSARRAVEQMLAKDSFSAWLGIELIEVRPGYAAISMTVRNEMLNGFELCHGGIPFSLADSALAFAANTHGRVSLSVEAGMAYASPIKSGDVLSAVAEEQSSTHRTGIYTVVVARQDGAKVAFFRGTVYRTDRNLFDDQQGGGDGHL